MFFLEEKGEREQKRGGEGGLFVVRGRVWDLSGEEKMMSAGGG